MVIRGDELMVVSGISDWPRRVRELRREEGWRILSGEAAGAMIDEDELYLEGIDANSLEVDDYILAATEQDRDAAHRWHVANRIRRTNAGVQAKVLEYLRENVGHPVMGDELIYVAKGKTEWARRVRELRTEQGWPVVTKMNGRPDLPIGAYMLEMDRQSPAHDRKIPDSVRGAVLERDDYKCQQCQWTHAQWNPANPRHLELHHQEAHQDGGANTADNLISLCNICHDREHAKTSS